MKYNKIASERIEILMQRAEEAFAKDKKRANRYAELARKIGMRYNVRLPKKWKRRICRKCSAFLKPGSNCRVRIYKGRVIITCLECKNVVRIPTKED